jgi:hypothetical protein
LATLLGFDRYNPYSCSSSFFFFPHSCRKCDKVEEKEEVEVEEEKEEVEVEKEKEEEEEETSTLFSCLPSCLHGVSLHQVYTKAKNYTR